MRRLETEGQRNISLERNLEIKKALYELRHTPVNEILNERDLEIFSSLLTEKSNDESSDTASSLVLVMKSTRYCNLRCHYCHFWREGPNQVMPFRILAKATKDALADKNVRMVEFVWHGGETTLLPIKYYMKALWLQQQFRQPHQTIKNAIQSNGTRLSQEWLDFFKAYGINVGISLDGPPEVHDTRRITKAGKATSQIIRKNIQKLQDVKINFGILSVIDDEIIKIGPQRFLSYFNEIGVSKIAILNAIPDNETGSQHSYLRWEKYISFTKELFLLWYHSYREKIIIREFNSLIHNLQLGKKNQNTICIHAGNCMGKYLTIEPNGDVTACDKYIEDKDYLFGNLIKDGSLTQILKISQNLKNSVNLLKEDVIHMKSCSWQHICNGGCPHDVRLNKASYKTSTSNCCGLFDLIELINSTMNVKSTSNMTKKGYSKPELIEMKV